MRQLVVTTLFVAAIIGLIALATPIFEAEPQGHGQDQGRRGGFASVQPDEHAGLRATASDLFRDQRWAEAADIYRELTELAPDDGSSMFRLAYAVHAQGDYEQAIPLHRKAAKFGRFRRVALYNLGCALTQTGQTDPALKALEQAIEAGFSDLGHMQSDEELASLRDESRFRELLERIGLDNGPLGFWIGKWVVRNEEGRILGTNSVQRKQDGHVIHVQWYDMIGHSGQSFLYRDPATDTWKQVWFDSTGLIIRSEGTITDQGGLHLTGQLTRPDGSTALAENILRPQPDGRVHQIIQHSTDNGQTWEPVFEGTYERDNRPDFPAPLSLGSPENWR